MRADLLAWQRELYPEGHRDRTNLIIHVVTVPLFHMGLLTLVLGAVQLSVFTILSGWIPMIVALFAQGRGHRRERTPPVPFQGAGDVVTRLLAEQLVTFPRFLLSGDFVRAWRASR